MKPVFVVDGTRMASLEDAAAEFTRALGFSPPWRGNLDALNDMLRGDFGTPEDGFIIQWVNHAEAKRTLGYGETVRWLQNTLLTCHHQNRERVVKELQEAKSGRGPTVFEWLVEIIRVHCPGGSEAEDRVELELA